MRVSIEEGKEMEKKSWENRKGKGNSEAGIDLNNWLQLWDDNPLWVVKNIRIFMTMCFHPLGYGVKGKNIQTEKKIMYKENEKVLGEETFQMFLIDRNH
jgi:hypothetical protein